MSNRNTGRHDDLCFQMAAVQHGLFNLAQARAAGISKRVLHHRVACGRFHKVLPGVFAVAGAPRSWDRDLMAAVLWAGDGSAASGPAAARKWGIDGFTSDAVEISTVNHKERMNLRLPGGLPVIVHRVDRHLLNDIVTVDGISVTPARRTILDLCGMRHTRAERALDALLRQGFTEISELTSLLEQEWTRGRRGVAILRDFLIERSADISKTDSELEARMCKLLERAGLPAPVLQHAVTIPSGTIHIDLAYPQSRLAIELDGYAWHMDRRSFEQDRHRDNELRALGWTVLRFTWAMVRFDARRVIDLVSHHHREGEAWA